MSLPRNHHCFLAIPICRSLSGHTLKTMPSPKVIIRAPFKRDLVFPYEMMLFLECDLDLPVGVEPSERRQLLVQTLLHPWPFNLVRRMLPFPIILFLILPTHYYSLFSYIAACPSNNVRHWLPSINQQWLIFIQNFPGFYTRLPPNLLLFLYIQFLFIHWGEIHWKLS